MFPSENRLRREKDIKMLLAKGKSVFGSGLGLRLKKNNLQVSRFTVVVGVKVSKKAVHRNRLKRRIREIIHNKLNEIRPGFDVLVLTKREALEKSSLELETQINFLLKKSGLI